MVLRGRRKGFCTSRKWAKRGVFVAVSKTLVGRRGTCKVDLQRCISRGRRSTRDTGVRHVRRSGRWFPERSCILEHQIFRFAKMILRDRCITSYDLASLFFLAGSVPWTNGMEQSQNTLVGGRQLCTQLSIFEGSLAELLGFWRCQVQKLRKSRRVASFLMLSTSKIEEVSQNSFVFKACRKTDK